MLIKIAELYSHYSHLYVFCNGYDREKWKSSTFPRSVMVKALFMDYYNFALIPNINRCEFSRSALLIQLLMRQNHGMRHFS